jgi:hypothetical protein
MATALGSRTSGLRKRIPTSDGPGVVHGLSHEHGSPPLEVRLDVCGGQVPVLADYGNNYPDLPPWYSSGELAWSGFGTRMGLRWNAIFLHEMRRRPTRHS